MNERLKSYGIDTRDMSVQTMHSFCYRLLKDETYRNWNLDDSDKYTLMIKMATGFRGMKWSGVDITLVESFISLCKNSLIRPEQSVDVPFLKGDPFFGDMRYPQAYFEIEELRREEGIDVKHCLMVDAHYTWWDCGKSYLCRILDMLHMGYVDEVLFGREVVEQLPKLVKEWVRLVKGRG